MYLNDIYTVSANLAGIPAISIPWGRTPARPDRPVLPIGLQLMAPDFSERRLFEIAHFLEGEAPA
jgi:aspartyl-tRNA(Asn)/glutamyl-tRNA(Gln) amidotransferase subunit A